MVAYKMKDKQERFVRLMKILYVLTIIPAGIMIYLAIHDYEQYAIAAGFLGVAPIGFAMSALQYKFEIGTDEDMSRFWYGQTAKNWAILGAVISLAFLLLGVTLLYFASQQ